MASLGDMVVRIRGDMTDFNRAIDASETRFRAATANFQKLGTNLTKFVTVPILGIGAAAVKAAADMEMQEAAFETMLGSAEKAKDLLQELNTLAAKTPFQMTDLAEATKTMLAFGIAQEEVLPNLQMLGDIAGGNSDKLRSLTLAFSQIQSTGRLMGQDLLQLINAGFNPLQTIAEKTGKTMAELKKDMENGAISAEMVSEAFKIATSEGGRFFGGMERASLTLKGQFSTLLDNIMMLGRGLGDVLLPPLKNIVTATTEIVQKFTAMDGATRTAVVQYGLLAAAIGPVILGVLKLIEIMPILKTSLTALAGHPVVAAMIVLGATFAAMAININKVQSQFKILDSVMNGAGTGDIAEDLKIINKELENLYASQAGSSGLFPDEDLALQEQINKLQTIKTELAEKNRWQAMNVRGQIEMNKKIDAEVLSQDEITKAIEARAKVTELYLGARSKVLNVLESEKTEYQKIQDQIEELEKTPWVSGKLEDDRLLAIQVLRERQKAILDDELQQRISNAETIRQRVGESESEIEQAIIMAGQVQAEIDQAELDRIEEIKQARIQLAADIVALTINLANSIETIMGNSISAQIALLREQYAVMTVEEQAYQDFLDAKEAERYESLSEAEQQEYDLRVAANESREQAERDLAQDIYELELERFKTNKKFALAQIAIETALAVAKVWGQTGVAGFIAQAGPIAMGILQAAAVNSQVPPAPPALAEGGVVMPTPGGTLAQIAEAGQPEAVIPLDRFGEFGGDIHLVVNLDSKPFLDKIFPATRNRTILISAGAVV
jgi:tape measure domain-containing protein